MKIIVTGATGMVGSEVLRQTILDQNITEATAIVRKPLEIHHQKVKTVIHENFLDYSNLYDVFRNNDACLWCLGISQNQVSKEQYTKITFDYTVEFAKQVLEANPAIHFLFVSGAGADSTEKSRVLFARIKGKAENALMQMPFKKLHIARPAGIVPVHIPKNLPFILKLQYAFVKVMKFITPSLVITSAELAKALLYIAKNDAGGTIVSNAELKQLSTVG